VEALDYQGISSSALPVGGGGTSGICPSRGEAGLGGAGASWGMGVGAAVVTGAGSGFGVGGVWTGAGAVAVGLVGSDFPALHSVSTALWSPPAMSRDSATSFWLSPFRSASSPAP